MTGVTNRIPFEEAVDLVGSARACVAFVVDGRPRVQPVAVRYEDGRFVIAIAEGSPSSEANEAVLIIDDGVLFFDLRAIYVRGSPSPIDQPDEDGSTWCAIEPTNVTCWDYGRLRRSDESE